MIRAHLIIGVYTIVQSDLDRLSCIWENKAQLPPLPIILAWYHHPPHFRDFTGFVQVDFNLHTSHDLIFISLSVEEGGQLMQIATSYRAIVMGKTEICGYILCPGEKKFPETHPEKLKCYPNRNLKWSIQGWGFLGFHCALFPGLHAQKWSRGSLLGHTGGECACSDCLCFFLTSSSEINWNWSLLKPKVPEGNVMIKPLTFPCQFFSSVRK